MEGDAAVAGRLDEIRSAAVDMADALVKEDFADGEGAAPRMECAATPGSGVSTPLIDQAIASAVDAGAWGGKACGAGGGGCVVFLSPEDRRDSVAKEMGNLGEGRVLEIRVVNEGLKAQEKRS